MRAIDSSKIIGIKVWKTDDEFVKVSNEVQKGFN